MHTELQLDNQICFRAYELVPAGMGKRLSACPLKSEDYQRLAQELDSIIDTLKK